MAIFITKDKIQSEVDNYKTLSFFKKSKNQLVCFIVFISLTTLLFLNYLVQGLNEGFEPTENSEVFFSIAVYLALGLFIFLNHRWAMVVFALLYLADKVILIMSSVGFPISHIMFGAIAAILSYNAFKVASDLKKAKKTLKN